jgi:TseV toxin immunity protein TsiV
VSAVRLPPALAQPVIVDGRPLIHTTLDVTLYVPDAAEPDLDFLIELYRRLCPPSRFVYYATAESLGWDSVDDPLLTNSGYEAARRSEPLPFLAPVRKRIRNDRPFFLSFWDGRDSELYAFTFRRERGPDKVQHTFVRFNLPNTLDAEVLAELTGSLADGLPFLSGHAGIQFGYDPGNKFAAFSRIYPLARRYWGVDVEDLNGTLPLTRDAIKGISWLTLLGGPYLETGAATRALAACDSDALLTTTRRRHGLIFRVGDAPVPADRHRPPKELDAMMALGSALDDLVVADHPSFEGDGFIDHADTNGWFHRFANPAGWS